MKEILYLMVLVEVQSSLKHISDTVHEIETEAALMVSDTRNVKILKTELLLTRVRNPKKH
ncbi:hypothetical protein BCY91_06755 [Pelobium manganitolerans]|uniref:Uncharacterized protein n=1 Tax=Pelobium manganitolerans TaxID=1842495 RepID=A0A419S558_9SPHI|nr:hypothetical protein BCY91_06755 [Pelobium manganitolerans]